MTVSTSTNKTQALGNGATTSFPYSFRIYSAADLVVTRTVIATGVDTVLVLNTDYTVTGASSYNGGNVVCTVAPATGTRLTIQRLLTVTQQTDLRNQGAYFAETHEDVFDRHTMVDQQQQEEINRSIKFPEADEDLTSLLPAATDRANKAIIFDEDGNVTVSDDDYNDQFANVTAQAGIATAAAASATASASSATSSASSATASQIAAALSAIEASGYAGNFTQAGTGAVLRTAQNKMRETVSVTDFGAVGDGTTNDVTAIQNAFNAVAPGGKLIFPPGTYWIGNVTNFQKVLTLADPINVVVEFQGARLTCTSTGSAPVRPIMIYITNPNNVRFSNFNCFDNGFSSSGWSAGDHYGAYGIVVNVLASGGYTATNPCRGFYMDGAIATNMEALISFDSANQLSQGLGVYYGMQDVAIQGHANNCYYGVSYIYSASKSKTSLNCTDVRRGVVSYGLQDAFLDFTLVCTAGFLGSNAFVNLATEGVVGGSTNNVKVNVLVSGVEAHVNYVSFYQQGDPATTAGVIQNISCDVRASSLTTVGKNVLIGNTNLYCLVHEYPPGNTLTSANSTTQNIKMDGAVSGTISGAPIYAQTVPTTYGSFLEIAPTLARQLTTVQAAFIVAYWDVTGATFQGSFTPTVAGLTTAGTATYSVQSGYYQVINGRCFFDLQVVFTGATGTGNMSITGLPFSWNKIKTNAASIPQMTLSTAAGAGNVAVGHIAGDTRTVYCYTLNQTTNVLGFIAMAAAKTVYASGSYVI